MSDNEGHVAVAGLHAESSRCNLAIEPWSQALVLLLETVEQQSNSIRRLENIVAADAFGAEYDQPGLQHTQTSLAVSLARGLKDAKQHVQQLQCDHAVLQQQQKLAACASTGTAAQLQQLELRMQQLEHQQQAVQQQIGLPGRLSSTRSPSPSGLNRGSTSPTFCAMQYGKDQLPAASATADAAAQGPIAVRLLQLEHQVHHLTETAADAQERTQAAASAVLVLDEKVDRQLSNIRTDTKQAITVAVSVASNTLKAELQADIHRLAKDRNQQMKHDMEGVSGQWEANLNSVRAAIQSSCSAEVSTCLSAALDSQQQKFEVLQQQLNRLKEEKVDMRLLTQYTRQVNTVFEQLSATLVDSTQASITELVEKQQQLASTVHGLSATKADHGAVLQLQQQCQQQVEDLYCALAAARQAAGEANDTAAATHRALGPVAMLRLELADTQRAVTALQAAVAGMASSTEGHSAQLQNHSKQLQRLGGNHHMLQQQLIALTNQVDPAAAAVLAAAAAGNDDVTAVTMTLDTIGSCNTNAGDATAGDTVVSDKHVCSNSTLTGLLFRDSDASVGAGCSEQQQPSTGLLRHKAALSSQQSSCAAEAAKCGLDNRLVELTGAAATRHLPLAMRLCLLESSLQELSRSSEGKASAVDLAGLAAQVELLSKHSASMSEALNGVHDSSIRRIEEQLAKLTASLADAVADRPSSTQVHAITQRLVAGAEQSAAAAAVTAVKASVAPLQQQLQEAWGELEAAKGQLAAAQQELSKISEWQISLGDLQTSTQMQLVQLRQLLTQQLQEDRHSLQQHLDSSIRTATEVAVNELMISQAACESSTSKQLSQVSALSDQVTVLTGQVEMLDQQAAAVAQAQEQHNRAIAALETAITLHINQCEAAAAAANQQQQQQHRLQQEITAALQDCQQMHDARLVTMESAAKEQATAVSDMAGIVAGLPSKAGIREAVLAGTKATAGAMLQEHKQDEEHRWEVWLSEFARALELRPTQCQLEHQISKVQQQLMAVQGAAADSVDAAVAKAVAAAMNDGIDAQLKILDMRVDTLEEGLHCSAAAHSSRQDLPSTATADSAMNTAAPESALTAGQLAALVQQVRDAQQQLLSKADKHQTQLQFASLDDRYAAKGRTEEQLQQLKQQILTNPDGLDRDEQVLHLIKQQLEQGQYVARHELDGMLQKKLDIEAFLASVAARRCVAVS